MERKIVWNKKAVEKLEIISSYLDTNFSAKQVSIYHNQIQKVLTIVSKYPEAGNLEFVKRAI